MLATRTAHRLISSPSNTRLKARLCSLLYVAASRLAGSAPARRAAVVRVHSSYLLCPGPSPRALRKQIAGRQNPLLPASLTSKPHLHVALGIGGGWQVKIAHYPCLRCWSSNSAASEYIYTCIDMICIYIYVNAYICMRNEP